MSQLYTFKSVSKPTEFVFVDVFPDFKNECSHLAVFPSYCNKEFEYHNFTRQLHSKIFDNSIKSMKFDPDKMLKEEKFYKNLKFHKNFPKKVLNSTLF